MDTLDCQDGSYILRYRLHETCFNVNMTIRVDSKPLSLKNSYFEGKTSKICIFKVCRSLIFSGPIYAEDCYCPNPSLQSWMVKYNCNQNDTKIFKSLEEFSSVDFDIIREQIIDRYNKPNSVSICHYIIKDNQVRFWKSLDETFVKLC